MGRGVGLGSLRHGGGSFIVGWGGCAMLPVDAPASACDARHAISASHSDDIVQRHPSGHGGRDSPSALRQRCHVLPVGFSRHMGSPILFAFPDAKEQKHRRIILMLVELVADRAWLFSAFPSEFPTDSRTVSTCSVAAVPWKMRDKCHHLFSCSLRSDWPAGDGRRTAGATDRPAPGSLSMSA